MVAGSSATVEVALVARTRTATYAARSADRAGKGIAATLRFIGTTTFESRAEAPRGVFGGAAGGPYRVVVDVTGFPSKEVPSTSSPARTASSTSRCARQPGRDVDAAGDRASRADQVQAGAPKLAPASRPSWRAWSTCWRSTGDQDAAHRSALERRRGRPKKKGRRSQQAADGPQAKAIRDYLIAKGAPADRIEAVGRGATSRWFRTSGRETRPRTAGSSWSWSARAGPAGPGRGGGASRGRGYNRAHAVAFPFDAGFTPFTVE